MGTEMAGVTPFALGGDRLKWVGSGDFGGASEAVKDLFSGLGPCRAWRPKMDSARRGKTGCAFAQKRESFSRWEQEAAGV